MCVMLEKVAEVEGDGGVRSFFVRVGNSESCLRSGMVGVLWQICIYFP